MIVYSALIRFQNVRSIVVPAAQIQPIVQVIVRQEGNRSRTISLGDEHNSAFEHPRQYELPHATVEMTMNHTGTMRAYITYRPGNPFEDVTFYE